MMRLWNRWKRLAAVIGDLQARALLTLFYFVILAPFALVVRWSSDAMAIKPGAARGWRSRASREEITIERATRQF